MKTVKEILDKAMDRAKITKPAQYFGSKTSIAELANEALTELNQVPWVETRKEGSITLTAAEEYDIPTDLRYFIADTMQTQDQERIVRFPAANSEWSYYNSRSEPSGIRYKIKFYGGKLRVVNPHSGTVLYFEYLTDLLVYSESAIAGGGDADKTEFTRDSDTFLLEPELLIRELKWRIMQQRGIKGWEVAKLQANDWTKRHRGSEEGSRTLDFSGGHDDYMGPTPWTDLYI